MSTPGATPSTPEKGQDEEGLRNQLRAAMQSLKRREPLDPKYKRLLIGGVVTNRRPVLPKDKFYKRIGSDLRARVEKFMQQTEGKDPFDRISARQPLEEEQMRGALTLREAKKHEQKALLDVTLSALPRRNGMDAATRRRHLEGITLGLQSVEKKPVPRPRTPTPSIQTEQSRQNAELERQREQARAREEARRRREIEERQRREDEMKRKKKAETPQQALQKLYKPIFKILWEMEFQHLGGTNPFRIVIDRDSCASLGAPDYFDVIEKPMNLTYIQQKVEKVEYESLKDFNADVDLMLSNAVKYNSDPNNPYRIAAEEMRKLYKKKFKKLIQTLQQQRAKRDAS